MNAKIAVVGAGRVGSTLAYTLAASRVAREIVVIDANHERATFSFTHPSFTPPAPSRRERTQPKEAR